MVSSTTLLVDIHDIKLDERLTNARTIYCILKTICLHHSFNIISTNIHLSPETMSITTSIQTHSCNIFLETHPSQNHASFHLHSFDNIESADLFEIYEFLTLAFDAPYKSEYITITNTFAPDPIPEPCSDASPDLVSEPCSDPIFQPSSNAT